MVDLIPILRTEINTNQPTKAKVMGFNELEEARAKRAEKEAAQAAKSKAKRGRKRKGADVGQPAAKVQKQSEEQVAGRVGSAWRAPEAPMIHNRVF
jgi:hypothetical protein